MPKKVLFICLRNFRSCSLFGRILSFSLTMSKLQVLWKFLSQNSFTANFFIAKQPHIDHTTRAIKQNINRMLHGKSFQFYCSNLVAPPFAVISDLLAKFLLKDIKIAIYSPSWWKFNQASNPHPPRQQNFVKTNTA